ncbi:MAG: hypothetical protein P8Z79_12495, partial [Sedimentisphaerales bacterium]
PDPPQTRYLRNRVEQTGQPVILPLGPMTSLNGLETVGSEKNARYYDFLMSGLHKGLCLTKNGLDRLAVNKRSGFRYYTIAATAIAAILYLKKGSRVLFESG